MRKQPRSTGGRRRGRAQVAAAALVAAAVSLATVFLLELLRGEDQHTGAVARPAAAAEPAAAEAPEAPATLVEDDTLRRAEVERRLSAIEARLEMLSVRQPVPREDNEEEWRKRVTSVVDQELERRRAASEEEAQAESRENFEREIRTQVAWMRNEYDLTDYEEEALGELLVAVQERRIVLQLMVERNEIEPEEYVREAAAIEEWIRDEAIQKLGAERAEEILGL